MKSKAKILLIEDNNGDVELITGSFKNLKLQTDIKVINNGEEAMSYLNLQKQLAVEDKPDLILLDINIPKIDGKEILYHIKTNSELRMIPVLMLTTSSLESDISYCYDNHANCYLVKPADLNQYIHLIRSIESFWLDCVTYFNNS